MDYPETTVETAEQLAPPPDSTAAQPGAQDSEEHLDAHAARLLIVSEEAKVAPQTSAVAQAVGFDCDICTYKHAMSLVKSGNYHAVLVDMDAGGETGLQLIKDARAMTTARPVPMVAIAETREVMHASRAGAAFTVARPVSVDLLRNTMGALYRMAVGLRRQYARYRIEVPLTLNFQGHSIEAKATDIGHGGFALVATEPLTVGSVASARFLLPGSEEQIIAVGEIRWSDAVGRAGLCFTSLAGTGRESLENWMARRHAGIEQPEPQTSIAPRPPQAFTAEDAKSPGRKTGRLILMMLLIAYCLFMVGFWIYLASSN